MAHKLKGVSLSCALAIVTLFLFGVIDHAAADSDKRGFGKRIAGSYLIRHDTSGSRDMVTLTADGIFLLTSSDAGAFEFGNSQGVWKRTGRRQIAGKVVNFDFNDNGVAIIRFMISFDRRFSRVTGSFAGEVVDAADPDPLKEENILFRFSDSFAGQRITVD